MESSNNSVCRTCLAEGELKSIFEKTICSYEYSKLSLSELIMECSSVKIEKNDKLPTKICKNCIYHLKHAYLFKKQCENTDAVLRARVNDQDDDSDPLTIKTEPKNEFFTPKTELTEYGENSDLYESFQNTFLENNSDETSDYACGSNKSENNSPNKEKDQLKGNIDEDDKKLTCETCDRKFANPHNLYRHSLIHTSERHHACTICNKTFRGKLTLEVHLREHAGETSFMCKYCNESFNLSSLLRSHIEQEHTDVQTKDDSKDQLYVCNICNRSYSKLNYYTHVKRHGEKKFLCSECGKKFVNKMELKVHCRIHSGLKPFQCTTCGKSFAQLGHLKRHSYLHTGEKQFSCELCDKAFTLRHHLAYHMQTHNGERPFVCTICGKSFPYQKSLSVHQRTHTGESHRRPSKTNDAHSV